MSASDADSLHSKVAAVTLTFWVMKIAATTLGETAGDLLSMTLNLGYVASSAILLAIFADLLAVQLSARRFHPVLFFSPRSSRCRCCSGGRSPLASAPSSHRPPAAPCR